MLDVQRSFKLALLASCGEAGVLGGNRHANNTGACAYIFRRRRVPALGQYHYGNVPWILWFPLFELDNKAVQ